MRPSATPRGGSSAPAQNGSGQVRHIPATPTSYESAGGKVNLPRPEPLDADAAPWPEWCHVPVERLNLDAFDEHGCPVAGGGY